MRYDRIKDLSCENFRRLTGIKPKTFGAMLGELELAERKKHARGGRHSTQPLADRLLMALGYWREYRTFYHIAASYEVSESACWKTIRWVEDVLITSKLFRLPGRKALLASDVELEVVLVDATETPCERPKKNSASSIRARKSGTR